METVTAIENQQGLAFHLERLGRFLVIATAFALPISTVLTQIFFFSTILCGVFSANWQKAIFQIKHNRVMLMFLVFFAMFLLGLFYTSASFSDAMHTLGKYEKFFFAIFLFPILADSKVRKYAIYTFLSAVMITLVLSFLKFFANVGFLDKPAIDSGVFKDYIATGFLMAFSAYCFGMLWFNEVKPRWLFAVLFLLCIFDVFFISQGRTAYVVSSALLFLLFWQHLKWKGIVYAALISLLLMAGAMHFSHNFQDRIQRISGDISHFQKGDVNTSVGLRTEFVKNSLKLVATHPWFGTGTGSFKSDYAKIGMDPQLATSNPHNEYMNIAVQFGLFGVIILFLLFYCHWRYSYKLPRDMRYFAQAVLLSIAIGCCANSWLMDFFQGYFYVYFTALAFAALGSDEGTLFQN